MIVTMLFSYIYINLNKFGEKLGKLCGPKVLSMPKSLILHAKLAVQGMVTLDW